MTNVFTPEAVAVFAYQKGLRGEPLATAVAIAYAESSLDADKHNLNPHTGDDSYGLWQINLTAAAGGPARRKQFNLIHDSDLLDPVVNARAMYEISGGGTNWAPWSTFKSGIYRRYLSQATAAAATVGAQAGGAAPAVVTGDGSTAPVDLGSSDDIYADYFVDVDSIADYEPSRFADQLRFMRVQGPTTPQLTGGKVEMSTDAVTEMTLEYAEPINNPAGDILLLTQVTWRSLVMVVTAREFGPGQSPEQLTITAQPAGVSKMREVDPIGTTRAWTNSSPTEVIEQRAIEAGLRFVGKGTQRRSTITRHGKSETGAAKAESDWDMADRLAKEVGFWFFEVDGVVVFAPPSWIDSQFPTYNVRWRTTNRQWSAVECPTARVSINTDRTLGQTLWPRTLSFTVPRNRGELIRPGMVVDFDGLPGFAGRFITTRVQWPVDDYTTPVTVEAVEPIDPLATDPLGEKETADDGAPSQGSGVDDVARHTNPGGLGPTALDFVTLCLKQVGDRYVLGAAHDAAALNNPDPSAFDCSGLVGWACFRLGVGGFTGTAGLQMRKVIDAGLELPVARAAHIRGAILYRGTLTNPNDEHIAVSLGDGVHTIEAMGRAYGVLQGTIGNRFTRGGRIPGLDYAGAS